MSPHSIQPPMRARSVRLRPEHLPPLVLAAGVIVTLTALSRGVWLVLLAEGLLAVGVVVAACGWGAWPVVWLGLGRRTRAQQLCISAALGLGLLSVFTLGLGVTGWLGRVTAWALVIVGWALGLARVGASLRTSGAAHRKEPQLSGCADPQASACAGPRGLKGAVLPALLCLTLVVPLAVALFGASLPPGVLWSGEARGYDVLEYHLQAPREYYDAGRIQFLLHNVYASFPQQMEMLYLLLMHLAGGPLAGAIPAQLLHALCGVLAVVALAAWTAPGWPRLIVLMAAGSVPWLAYLGCLAYVELGMLFFAAVAAGLLTVPAKLDLAVLSPDAGCDWRTALAAGLCAGLAGGCKYTALVLVAAALGLAWCCAARGALRARARPMALYAIGVAAAFAPWLVRNAALAGNPVYPFAYRWLGGAAWSTEQDEQWARGHRLAPETAAAKSNFVVPRRLRIAVNEVLASRMFGPTLFILALAGLLLARSRQVVFLAVWAALIVVGWAVFTHMPGRFAAPLIVPLALLIGAGAATCTAGAAGDTARTSAGTHFGFWILDFGLRAVPTRAGSLRAAQIPGAYGAEECRRRRRVTVALATLATVGAVGNAVTLLALLRADRNWWAAWDGPLADLPGQTELFAQSHPLRQFLPAGARVWSVGDAAAFYAPPEAHYTVAFNRDPWLDYARTATAEQAVAWLRTQRVTHLVFSWTEIERLRGTYGFPDWVTPAWVQRLQPAGLRPVALPDELARGIAVYEVEPG
jgi:hypothetical protein